MQRAGNSAAHAFLWRPLQEYPAETAGRDRGWSARSRPRGDTGIAFPAGDTGRTADFPDPGTPSAHDTRDNGSAVDSVGSAADTEMRRHWSVVRSTAGRGAAAGTIASRPRSESSAAARFAAVAPSCVTGTRDAESSPAPQQNPADRDRFLWSGNAPAVPALSPAPAAGSAPGETAPQETSEQSPAAGYRAVTSSFVHHSLERQYPRSRPTASSSRLQITLPRRTSPGRGRCA